MNIPASALAVRLHRVAKGEQLVACKAVRFAGGAAAIATTFLRAEISGRADIGGKVEDHFADLLDERGDLIETVALDRGSYGALKYRWMRCLVERLH
jgi:hypothetical protein